MAAYPVWYAIVAIVYTCIWPVWQAVLVFNLTWRLMTAVLVFKII